MKHTHGRRILSMILVICMLLGMIPAFVSHVEVEAEAVSGVSSLTCSGFISNSTRQIYIDTMMKYYINNYSSLQSTLNNGLSVVFMFEGGSDYYDTYEYVDGTYQTRLQAVCIVVQMNSSGNAEIVFYSENCSSIPDDANWVTPGYETSGSTTILDGIYTMTTVNHNGNYAAHTTNCYTGWYCPYDGTTGYSDDCNGINIHTRSVSYCFGQGIGCHSAGCQLIGYGQNSSNEYNEFMKVVTGISFNAYDGTQRTMSNTYQSSGYYVVDRQLGLISPNGTEYGSGSLAELYTKDDLAGITAFSTKARANADFDYASKCTPYPSHCQIKVTLDGAPINSQPCSVSTENDSSTLESAAIGATYTATKLYQNEYGNYWYRVTTSAGETGYIYGGEVEYIEDLTSDITISDHDVPNGHVAGEIFYVSGDITSKYNMLTTAAVWILSGFGDSGSVVTGDSDDVNGYSYELLDSAIDYNTAFDDVGVGNYTYLITADYINYYTDGATTLKSNTGTIDLCKEYFVTVSSSVDQSSCTHSYTSTTLEDGTCTEPGLVVQSCSTCGQVIKSSVGADGHSYGSWTTVAATCTADGYKTRTCSACGDVQKEVISATGHSYSMKETPATCNSYASYTFTCTACGDHYTMTADELASGWIDHIPAGMDSSLFRSKTQYRYSDYQTVTSYESSMDGYTLKSSTWEESGSGTVTYVNSWPSGFDTGNSLYSEYNNKSSKVTVGETSTTRTVVNSDAVVGYLWYHWCGGGSYSTESETDSYGNFHAFYSTDVPGEDTDGYDASDGSYKLSSSTACSTCLWYWPIEVYAQNYTTYDKLFTYERWTDFSDWSDTAVSATSTRKVESRTVYQLKEAALGDHTWVDGVCSSCNTVCSHSFVNGYCSVCGMEEPNKDYYLFGYINGANYACEEDYENIGSYKFVNGKLVATFTDHSYVAVKTGDNSKWYMTDGYVGDDATSATLYETSLLGENADKLRVPMGREITFTLVVNDDGTVTLSYVASECEHVWSDGVCSTCGDACAHDTWTNGVCNNCGITCSHGSWTDGVCDDCGYACSHSYSNNVCKICGADKPVKDYYLFGWINGADYACEADYQNLGEYKFVDGKVTTVFTEDSYVAVKSGDNQDWYMTNGWLGFEVTAATLYKSETLQTAEKLYVPGGVEVTFTLIDNGNDTFLLTYVVSEVPVAEPTLTLDHPTLSFESEIRYNVYYTAENIEDVVEMGLITFDSKLTDGTIEDAVDVIAGYDSSGTSYMVHTNGIPAPKMGDAVYFKIYAKLSDGSYIYSDVAGYNAVVYARTILNSSTSSSYMKSLVVALLNYGAEAQVYFEYNATNLMNSFFTAAQKALVDAYDESMVDPVITADASKASLITYDGSSYTRRYPSVSFDGAFALNFYFTTANVPEGEVKMYYWTLEDYNAATTLKPSNASGRVVMTSTGSENQYWGKVPDIAAKQLDETVFVAGFYTYGGVTYSTGLLSYSIGRYCESIAASDSSSQQALAQDTAVYGYYAKQYFENL